MYPGQDPRSLNLFSIISPPDLSLSRNLLLSTWWLAQLGSGTVVSLTAQVLVLNKASQYTATGYRRSDWLTGNLLLKVTWIQALNQINSGDVFQVSVFLSSRPYWASNRGRWEFLQLRLKLDFAVRSGTRISTFLPYNCSGSRHYPCNNRSSLFSTIIISLK